MADQLAGRRILVTGAGGAIGVAASEALRERGALVLGLDLEPGPDVIAADVTEDESVRDAVAEALDRLGGLDVLVNNAGIGDATETGALPDERARRILEVNLFGVWRVTAAALPSLLESGGRVIVVASGMSFVNLPLAAAYMASKRGVAAYADALRLEHGDRISVTTVYPGYIRTPIHDAAAARGVSLDGAIPPEPLSAAVSTIVRACGGRSRRDMPTSAPGRVGIGFARHFPGLADRLVRLQVGRMARAGRFDGAEVGKALARRASR